MKRRYLLILVLAIMSCGNGSVRLSNYSVRIPGGWDSAKISETATISGVNVKMLRSFTDEEAVINASILEVKNDTGIDGLNGYFFAVSKAFPQSEAHLSQISVNDIDVKSIRVTDGNYVILKSVFYEKSRGFLQLDFIIPADAFEKYSQLVTDIVNTIE